MSKVYREDRVKLDSPIKVDDFGIMSARARIARIGVQKYRIDGKLVRELRSPEEVMKSVASFESKPITLNHPRERVVNSQNARYEMKGFVRDTSYVDGWIEATTYITHADAIESAQTTHSMFSAGYLAEVVFLDSPEIWIDTEGVMGEKGKEYEYDAYQQNISGNHVALTGAPRAGSSATFISDSEDSSVIIIDTDTDVKNTKDMTENNNTVTKVYSVTIGDNSYEIQGDQSLAVIQAVAEMSGKLDGLEGQLEEANARVAQLESTRVDSNDIEAEVVERVTVWAQVQPHLDSTVDYSLSALDVKRLYLKSVSPHLAAKIDSASEAYIAGLWDVQQPAAKNDAQNLNEEVLTKMDSQPDTTKYAQNDDLAELQANYRASRAAFFNS